MNDDLRQWLDDIAATIRTLLADDRQYSSACLWAAAPGLLFGAEYEADQPNPARLSPITDLARHWGTVTSSSRGPTATLQGDVLFVYDQVNPRRTLEAIIAARANAGVDASSAVAQPTRARRLAAWTKLSRTQATSTKAALADRGLRAPARLSETLLAAARAVTRAEAVVATHDLKAVVVATQHGTSARAYLHCARNAGLPTVYIPHAPVADNVQYRDLPCDYVGLRGAGEVGFYQDLGVQGQLDVVGNPAATVLTSNSAVVDGGANERPVFAPSPVPVAQLRPQVDLIRRVFGAEVTLAPHPAMQGREEYAALWPDWTVHDGRTLELLQAGVPFLVQSSSGVAWEAIAHGVATVELSLDGEPARYPFIHEPEIPHVRDENELRKAFDDAMQEPAGARSERVALAKHWCSESGEVAAASGAELIERAVEEGAASDMIWDGWRPRPN